MKIQVHALYSSFSKCKVLLIFCCFCLLLIIIKLYLHLVNVFVFFFHFFRNKEEITREFRPYIRWRNFYYFVSRNNSSNTSPPCFHNNSVKKWVKMQTIFLQIIMRIETTNPLVKTDWGSCHFISLAVYLVMSVLLKVGQLWAIQWCFLGIQLKTSVTSILCSDLVFTQICQFESFVI